MSFSSERATIAIEEEVRIVRAYIEIEQQRLGSKLRAEIDVDPSALKVEVPVLSIQPLVENAVKHGVAPRPEGGLVRLRIKTCGDTLSIGVTNTGTYCPETNSNRGTGVGLSNVRRRLALCFGKDTKLGVLSHDDMTTVSFSIPSPVLTGTQTTAR
jgi:LytS/YehU family sensor histidine kinase